MTGSTPPPRIHRGILLWFAVLFGAGILVYSVAQGRPGRRASDRWERARMAMVDEQIAARGVKDAKVLAALRKVPRHQFVPDRYRSEAYQDHPLPIGHGQTISQPYIVGAMTELLQLAPNAKVLEVGTGSGYQAAVLAELGVRVFTIEIVEPLAKHAAEVLAELGYDRVQVKTADGYAGWPSEAPFDAIIVTAAPKDVPPPLIEQLRPGGRMVIPVGDQAQVLRIIEKSAAGEVSRRTVFGVRFVPMTGRAERGDPTNAK